MTNAQLTQTLKSRYAQYMGNHKKNIFWPLTQPNPNCTLCHNNDQDTWPHPLSTCEHPYLKGLRIARHNKAVHLITQTLQAIKNTRFYTLTNAGKIHNTTPEQPILQWFLQCTCPQSTCQCQAKLRPDILCILGAPNQVQVPIIPSHTHTIQFIEFTYYHDRFLEQALSHKHTKYDQLSQHHKKQWMENQPSHNHHSWCKRSHTQTLHE